MGKTQVWVASITGESTKLVNSWATNRSKVPRRHREVLEKNGFIWGEDERTIEDRLDSLESEIGEARADIQALGAILRAGFAQLNVGARNESPDPKARP